MKCELCGEEIGEEDYKRLKGKFYHIKCKNKSRDELKEFMVDIDIPV